MLLIGGYACLTGEAGIGKSALLAYFCRWYTSTHPDHVVISHFVGAGERSTNLRSVLRRLCYELASHFGLPADIPSSVDALLSAFHELLQEAVHHKRVVIILDSPERTIDSRDDLEFAWLPRELPDNTLFIISTSSETKLQSMRDRLSPETVAVGALEEVDCISIIDAFLRRYRKSMSETQRLLLLSKKGSGNPLYLLTALEELRTLGSYDEITDRIRELPEHMEALVLWILERLECDAGFVDEAGNLVSGRLVRELCSYIAVSRHGLAMAELTQLMHSAMDSEESASPRTDGSGNVAALVRLLRPHLTSRNELITFRQESFRRAVEFRYLLTVSQQVESHSRIASLLLSKGFGYDRTLTELVYHLKESGRDRDLVISMFGDFPIIKLARPELAAEVAGDYLDAMDASERLDDLIGAVLFCYSRSMMYAKAEALIYGDTAFLVGRLASHTLDWSYANSAQALIQVMIGDRELRLRTLCKLALGLSDCPQRRRMIGEIERLADSIENEGMSEETAFITLCVRQEIGCGKNEFDGAHSLVTAPRRTKESRRARSPGRHKLRVICLRAILMWQAGEREACHQLIGSLVPQWGNDLHKNHGDNTFETAVAVYRSSGSLLDATNLLVSAVRAAGGWEDVACPESEDCDRESDDALQTFPSLLQAARVGGIEWADETVDLMSDHLGQRWLGLIAIGMLTGRTSIRSRRWLFWLFQVTALSRLLLRCGFDALAQGPKFLQSVGRSISESLDDTPHPEEWEALGFASAADESTAPPSRNVFAWLGWLRGRVQKGQTDCVHTVLSSCLRRIRAAWRRRDELLLIARTGIECDAPTVARESLDRWLNGAVDLESLQSARSRRMFAVGMEIGVAALCVWFLWQLIYASPGSLYNEGLKEWARFASDFANKGFLQFLKSNGLRLLGYGLLALIPGIFAMTITSTLLGGFWLLMWNAVINAGSFAQWLLAAKRNTSAACNIASACLDQCIPRLTNRNGVVLRWRIRTALALLLRAQRQGTEMDDSLLCKLESLIWACKRILDRRWSLDSRLLDDESVGVIHLIRSSASEVLHIIRQGLDNSGSDLIRSIIGAGSIMLNGRYEKGAKIAEHALQSDWCFERSRYELAIEWLAVDPGYAFRYFAKLGNWKPIWRNQNRIVNRAELRPAIYSHLRFLSSQHPRDCVAGLGELANLIKRTRIWPSKTARSMLKLDILPTVPFAGIPRLLFGLLSGFLIPLILLTGFYIQAMAKCVAMCRSEIVSLLKN